MQMINIGTSKLYPWGWRLSLGLCMVPATTLLLGGIFLDDTPNSLCERGHPEEVGPPIPLQLHKPARVAGSLSVHGKNSARIVQAAKLVSGLLPKLGEVLLTGDTY